MSVYVKTGLLIYLQPIKRLKKYIYWTHKYQANMKCKWNPKTGIKSTIKRYIQKNLHQVCVSIPSGAGGGAGRRYTCPYLISTFSIPAYSPHSCFKFARKQRDARICSRHEVWSNNRCALTFVMCVVVVVLVVSEVMVWALSNTPGSASPLASTCWYTHAHTKIRVLYINPAKHTGCITSFKFE